MVTKKFPQRPIPLLEQIVMMKKHFPDFHLQWRKNIVTWIGDIQPSQLSRCYRVKISHGLHRAPHVYVLKPDLADGSNGEAIPHTYPGKRLCLYHPKKREWSQQKYVSETIVPWTSLWLFYYEIWQITGKWMGGGEHPDLKRRRKRTLSYLLKHFKSD